ncbi:hypothetical protein AK812_SmicGene14649 [Symbiodinium microadriaticum]|uniref:OTU domain-containing protein n=1 Tax=Symbiodinium microadriaticum TaxID=2951 RepID=A0A1Q9E4X8_SYMMI|nr:hypothetical protein AK812_SmicGene14649 [Symbiodinium microadriaticum]
MGRRQFGHRTETTAENQVRSWRVPVVPRHWDAEVVKEVLMEAGFTQVAITSRMVRKGTATWFVRAAGKEDLASISVCEGKENIEIFILPVQAGLSGAAQEAMETDETGKEVKKAKLGRARRDGNCLAHALGQGLTYLKQDVKQRPARLVRAELHAYMVRFAGFWDGRNTSDEEGKLATFEEYLQEMAGDSKYLGCLELTSASRAFDLTLIVVPVAAEDPPTRHGSGSRTLALWYHGDHYDLLLPDLRPVVRRSLGEAEDLDDLLEEEIPEAPPRPSRRRNNGQAEHIRKNHADVADRFGKAEARIAMVPWSMQLHGPARSADLFAMRQQNVKYGKQLRKIEEMQRQQSQQLIQIGTALAAPQLRPTWL